MSQFRQPGFHRWFCTGDEAFPAMLDAIQSARKSVRLETYIFADDELGRRFRDALVQAARRSVKVRVLNDAFGSQSLPSDFWEPLQAAGGEARWFNPMLLKRLSFRDHRKALVCDDHIAFAGGYNVSKEYLGDGVKSGWCDLGMEVHGSLAGKLADAFDQMFALADLRHKRFMRLRRSHGKRRVAHHEGVLLLSGPGRGANPFTRALLKDLARARSVQIIAAYFLPTGRLRRALLRVARRGGRVQLILAGKTDVVLSQMACRSLYRRLLRTGVEIYEYQAQILHAKLIIVDHTVYVGSSNLDPRSLRLNYELMLRFHDQALAEDAAHTCFERCLAQAVRIEREAWRKSRTWWSRLQQRWAYFLLVRVDPYVARWHFTRTPR